MKRSNLFFLSSLCLLATSLPAAASNPDYEKIADRIVNQSLEIKPGDLVVVGGAKTEILFMEELYVAIEKAGGDAVIDLYLLEADKRAIMETSIEKLAVASPKLHKRYENMDVYIALSPTTDPMLYADVPEEKLTALRKANYKVNKVFEEGDFNGFFFGREPTAADAEYYGVELTDLVANYWSGVSEDIGELQTRSNQIAGILLPDKMLHIQTSAGTDIALKLAKIPHWINTGRIRDSKATNGPNWVSLPAGEIAICAVPNSASGTVVVPSYRFRGNHIKNLRIEFKQGRITSVQADENIEKIREYLEHRGGDVDVLSGIDFGLNDNYLPLDGDKTYLSPEMFGVVSIYVGNNSVCKINGEGGFGFAIQDATVTVDNRPLVTKGKLQLAAN